jgi:mono/diheme cytochrome c family protein
MWTNRPTSSALLVVATTTLVPLFAAGVSTRSQSADSKPVAASASAPAPDVQAFIKQNCVGCHNERNKGAVRNFVLDGVDVASAGQHGEIWEKVVMKLRAGVMPPLSVTRRPDRALTNQVAAWLETELDKDAAAHPNPGRTEGLHRINRTEYKNAVRDVLGLDIDVASLLPPDLAGGGDANFDNIASALPISRSLLERYVSAARRVSRTAMSGKTPSSLQSFKVPEGVRQDVRLDGMPFGTRGGLAVDYVFPVDGVYKFDLRAGSGGPSVDRAPALSGEVLELSLDGRGRRSPSSPHLSPRGTHQGR